MFKRLMVLSSLFIFSSSVLADLESSIENIKEGIEDTKCHVRYYGPYVLCSTIGLSSFAGGSKCGLAILTALGLYGAYSSYQGYKTIKSLENKYKVTTKAADYWNNFYEDEKFLFCRWRQQDDRYEDGFYWPTAWLCHEERKIVRQKLIQDIHAQRIEIMSNGKKVRNPKPIQLMRVIHDELTMLEHDKKALRYYTNIYRGIEQPEAYHPDVSYKRILWPNYNRASKVYIEIVQMMKRLEVIRDIVAHISSEMPSGGWPKS